MHPGPNPFSAFLSYATQDSAIADAIHAALERFGKTPNDPRAVRVFHAPSNLAPGPDLETLLNRALHESEYFILLATPHSARSEWVRKELGGFLQLRAESQPKVLIVLLDGEILWDAPQHDFDWEKTTALPRLDRPIFSTEPLYLDARGLNAKGASLKDDDFRRTIASLSSVIRGIPKDHLIGLYLEERRVSRKQRLYARSMRALLSFGFASLIPSLLLAASLRPQLVMWAAFPMTGALSALASGLGKRTALGLTIGYALLAFAYAFCSTRPFNDNFPETALYFAGCTTGFALAGALGGWLTVPQLAGAGALAYCFGGTVAASTFLLLPSVRPESGSRLVEIGPWAFTSFDETARYILFDMSAYWWNDPAFYMPFVLGSTAGGLTFAALIARATAD